MKQLLINDIPTPIHMDDTNIYNDVTVFEQSTMVRNMTNPTPYQIKQAIEACKEVEQSTIYGDNVKRVCKNTREMLEKPQE